MPWHYQDTLDRLSLDAAVNFAGTDPELEETRTCQDYMRTLPAPVISGEGQISLPWPPGEVKVIRHTAAKPGRTTLASDLAHRNFGSFMGACMGDDPRWKLKRNWFGPFRRLGFAIWESDRMVKRGLEFENDDWGNMTARLYFAWRSVLSEQELVELDG
jgi:hypothetical protein